MYVRVGYIYPHIHISCDKMLRTKNYKYNDVFICSGAGDTMDGGARAMGTAGARFCNRGPRGRGSSTRGVSLHRRVRVRYCFFLLEGESLLTVSGSGVPGQGGCSQCQRWRLDKLLPRP